MRRPWNIINPPVYAVSTIDRGRLNVNICTYAMAISRNPKKYALSIEKSSKTFENINKGCKCVLQLLNESQAHLIRPLGKKSGYKTDKHAYLSKKDLLTDWNGELVLRECCAYILLDVTTSMDAGDHVLFIGDAVKYKTINENQILTFQHLIDQKIIL